METFMLRFLHMLLPIIGYVIYPTIHRSPKHHQWWPGQRKFHLRTYNPVPVETEGNAFQVFFYTCINTIF